MTPADLRAWQAAMDYTYTSAAAALGVGRSSYTRMLAGQTPIDRRTALACAALMVGLPPWPPHKRAQDAPDGAVATLV